MHEALARAIVEKTRQRHKEGDCPVTERAGQEQVEFALIETADQRDVLFVALKNMAEYWAYGMAKPKGAKPTKADDKRIEEIATDALNALHRADPTMIETKPWSDAEERLHGAR